MPSPVIRSTIVPTHYYAKQWTRIQRGIVASDGRRWSPMTYEEVDIQVLTDSALPTAFQGPALSSRTVIDYTTGTLTTTNTPSPYWAGDVVDLVIPDYGPTNQHVSSAWLMGGQMTVSYNLIFASNVIPTSNGNMWFSGSGQNFTDFAQFLPNPSLFPQDWVAGAGYYLWPCPVPSWYPSLVGGNKEHFVSRASHTVCDSGYRPPNSLVPMTLGTSETFTFYDDTQTTFNGRDPQDYSAPDHVNYGWPEGKWNPWVRSSFGSTKQLVGRFTVPAGCNPICWPDAQTPGASIERKEVHEMRATMSGMRFCVKFNFTFNAPPNAPGNVHVCADVFNNIIACAWFGNVSGANKPLWLGIHRSLTKNMGSGSGATSGWLTYKLQDVNARSEIGLEFLSNGTLCVNYETFDSVGQPTAQYRSSQNFGADSATWSAASSVSPNRAQTLNVGIGQAQTFRFITSR